MHAKNKKYKSLGIKKVEGLILINNNKSRWFMVL
jgi:hypothetical protein